MTTTSLLSTVVLRHVVTEDAGVWEDVLNPSYADVGVDFPPGPLDADLLVVMGGPVRVDAPRNPYMSEVVELIRSRHAAGRPVIGVGLGAQLLALALGGDVAPGVGPMQIGWSPVELTEQGRQGPLRHLADLPVLHWHGGRIELPYGRAAIGAGIERLAFDEHSPVQAFQSNHALGLQFNPQVDPDRIQQWLDGYAPDVEDQGVDVQQFRQDAATYGPAVVEPARLLLVEWLRGTGILAD